MDAPSGDQNGCSPSSVPLSGWGVSDSSDRRNNIDRPSFKTAPKTMRRPSGESAGQGAAPEVVGKKESPGGKIERRIGIKSGVGVRKYVKARTTKADAKTALSAIHARPVVRETAGVP